MILSCNSCEKKFVVPDNAIGSSGRLVQCSSCGNKWKQFPIKNEVKEKDKNPIVKAIKKTTSKKVVNLIKPKKKKIKKRGKPDLYSPEYLAKKHGILINEPKKDTLVQEKKREKISFGFYNSLLLFIVSIIVILRILYFAQEVIIFNFPFTQLYLEHLFETINNIKDIVNNFFY